MIFTAGLSVELNQDSTRLYRRDDEAIVELLHINAVAAEPRRASLEIRDRNAHCNAQNGLRRAGARSGTAEPFDKHPVTQVFNGLVPGGHKAHAASLDSSRLGTEKCRDVLNFLGRIV